MSANLRAHAEWAADKLQKSSMEISGTMRKHQLKLADRQCRMSELSGRVQSLIVVLCTSLYGARQGDELIRDAADVICSDLRRQYHCHRIKDSELRIATKLGSKIVDGGVRSFTEVVPDDILMSYDK